nr:hypothetical protein [Neobacillus sp. Marseille-Q6967]
MDKKQAAILANLIESSSPSAYEIFKLETVGGKLSRFHQWTNGKQVEAAFKITRLGSDTSYYFLFIDWHRNDNYYLVIYTHDKKTTVAEIQQVKEIDGTLHFVWMYKPFKRDGKNDVRKAYFRQMFGSTTVQIELPSSALDMEEFFNQLFTLCFNRLKADRIVDVFDFEQ